jgi:elongation factor P
MLPTLVPTTFWRAGRSAAAWPRARPPARNAAKVSCCQSRIRPLELLTPISLAVFSAAAGRKPNGLFEEMEFMSIKAIDLRRGMAVQYKDGVWVCVDNEKVAKGNWRSSQVVQLKNILTGQLLKERFRTEELFEEAFLEHRELEFSYTQGDRLVFVDPVSYEMIEMPLDFIGDSVHYLTLNLRVKVAYLEGRAITFELPNVVELKVVDTPPVLRGATATNQMKEALCEGGARIKVPPFIENGTVVKVDTRTGEYLGKV